MIYLKIFWVILDMCIYLFKDVGKGRLDWVIISNDELMNWFGKVGFDFFKF